MKTSRIKDEANRGKERKLFGSPRQGTGGFKFTSKAVSSLSVFLCAGHLKYKAKRARC